MNKLNYRLRKLSVAMREFAEHVDRHRASGSCDECDEYLADGIGFDATSYPEFLRGCLEISFHELLNEMAVHGSDVHGRDEQGDGPFIGTTECEQCGFAPAVWCPPNLIARVEETLIALRKPS